MEFLDIVNEKDEVVGKAPRSEIYEKLLPHRIVHVILFNSEGEMCLQLRSKEVSFCPSYWCTSAGGHVKSGETPEAAGLRELKEELGIKTDITFAYKDLYVDQFRQTRMKKILITFKGKYNGPFKINPEEVEQVKFFSMDNIQKMINKGEKFHPELLFLLERHFGIE